MTPFVKKTLLTLSILAAFPLMAATSDSVIYVTTFDDENGENSAACSIREALVAAEQNQPFGGCSAGNVNSSVTDVIQLKAGTYQLTKTLYPKSAVRIVGDAATNWNNKNPITNDYPKILPIATTIKGNNQFSLFDTTSIQKPTLILNNVELSNGYSSTRGAAIDVGGALNLSRVIISQSNAQDQGGAIYLSGVSSTLSMDNSIIRNNQAAQGAALGMSCLDGLAFTPRTITITNSSVIANGGSNTKSILNLCGSPTVTMTNNTIAQNVTSSVDGSVIKFTADSLPNTAQSPILSNQASLNLSHNTIVENKTWAALLYDSIASKNLTHNIIAYNDGYSCRHLLGTVSSDTDTAGLSATSNAFNLTAGSTSYCYLPNAVTASSGSYPNINIAHYSQATLLSPLQPQTAFTAYLPLYVLNNTGSNPLIQVSSSSGGVCDGIDQRGIARTNANNNALITAGTQPRCDIGSTEWTTLTAAYLSASNSNQTTVVKNFQAQVDYFQGLLDDPKTSQEFLNFYTLQRDLYKQSIIDYQSQVPYRGVLFDVYKASTPATRQNPDGSIALAHFDNGGYTVTTQPLSTAADVFASGNLNALPTDTDPNLKCEWNNVLKQVVMYRTDNVRSAAGDYSYCRYTITDNTNPSNSSTGLLQARFDNIAPTANDDAATFVWGTSQRVKVDLLGNDNDNGDGNSNQSNYPKGRTTFYVDKNGISAPIKLTNLDSNLTIEAQYSQLCPDESGATCYGGEIYISPKNTFNKFNYTVPYQVFDADGTLSNSANLVLTNTATTTDDTRKGRSGGSMGLAGLFGLIGLASYRRCKTRH